ncbi:MAG: SDR family oxidoreductase [Actinobacteria bacterium]|nr:SDR family oxidoreductase [Actinomycetota bacterium]
MTTVQGMRAVITGASSGIGKAFARSLDAAGVHLVLVGRSEERLATVASALSKEPVLISGDVSDATTARRAIQACLDTYGGLDIVLPNAGLYLPDKGWEVPDERVHHMITTNVAGVMHTVHAALPHLLDQGAGDIFVTSSVSGHQAISWEPVYTATKHAVQAFVHATRQQIVGSGVRLGAIAPGIVLNELWGVSESDSSIDDRVAAHAGIRSEDVAAGLMFMLTQPRHVTIRDLVMLPTAQPI